MSCEKSILELERELDEMRAEGGRAQSPALQGPFDTTRTDLSTDQECSRALPDVVQFFPYPREKKPSRKVYTASDFTYVYILTYLDAL